MKKLIQLLRDKAGTITIEFSLIAPMMIFGTLYASNLGFKVFTHQKFSSAISAGSSYLQDYSLYSDISYMRPVYDKKSETYQESSVVSDTKAMIVSASNNQIALEDIVIDTYCVCQKEQVDPETDTSDYSSYDFKDENTEFYTRTKIDNTAFGELCAFNCPGVGGRARVIAEIRVEKNVSDFFSDEVSVLESFTTRLR